MAETEGQIQNQKAENAKKIKELRFAGAELFDKEEEISEKQKVFTLDASPDFHFF